ncbi:MAG: triacylglycerol lipase [Lachnospiraceae bacterium]|nr:triacylglycerol lipase [Lachnospiraceae bacterium]
MTKNERRRLATCNAGCILLRLFMILLIVMIIGFIVGGLVGALPGVMNIWVDTAFWIWYIVVCVIIEAVIFWLGIIMVYFTANQLGIRWRVLGIVLGWVPIANIIMLSYIIHVASKEYKYEKARIKRDKERYAEQICKTKYPILMVHGVFFRDFKTLNYWGRIPKALEINGATIFYGNQRSAAAVRDCAVEIQKRILEIVEETGCDKVNVIAHSKGGLDTRAAITLPGVAEHVASLTTINTPHRGCEFAEYLLNKIPESIQTTVAGAYNAAAAKLGDKDPDFMAAVRDLTEDNCAIFNEEIKDMPGIFYQSFGTKINSPFAGSRFPLNMTTKFVEMFDGPNDGLVGVESFPWGERYQFIEDKSPRGISHGDMIDLNRENFDAFDVREFYVSVVADLKNRGL